MDEDELRAAKALVDSATPGPWRQDGDDRVCNGRCGDPVAYHEGSCCDHRGVGCYMEHHRDCITVARTEDSPADDAAFIAASRTLVPRLLDEVDRLLARVRELEHRRADDHVAWTDDDIAAVVAATEDER